MCRILHIELILSLLVEKCLFFVCNSKIGNIYLKLGIGIAIVGCRGYGKLAGVCGDGPQAVPDDPDPGAAVAPVTLYGRPDDDGGVYVAAADPGGAGALRDGVICDWGFFSNSLILSSLTRLKYIVFLLA